MNLFTAIGQNITATISGNCVSMKQFHFTGRLNSVIESKTSKLCLTCANLNDNLMPPRILINLNEVAKL
jgi:hypothetical protein